MERGKDEKMRGEEGGEKKEERGREKFFHFIFYFYIFFIYYRFLIMHAGFAKYTPKAPCLCASVRGLKI
jgi:hypothetical protein